MEIIAIIGVDLAGLLGGGRMASVEGGSVPSGVGMGRSAPSPADWGPWERRELPQRGPGRSPGRKWILAYLKATERSFLYLYDNIWGGDNLH